MSSRLIRMREDVRNKLSSLKFKEFGELGAMRVTVEDVEFVAIEDLLNGISYSLTHFSSRSATQFEYFLRPEAPVQEIATAMTKAFETVHPDRKTTA